MNWQPDRNGSYVMGYHELVQAAYSDTVLYVSKPDQQFPLRVRFKPFGEGNAFIRGGYFTARDILANLMSAIRYTTPRTLALRISISEKDALLVQFGGKNFITYFPFLQQQGA